MPKQIQDPLLGQLLQRLFKLQGRVEPSLDEIIVPTVRLADLSRGAPPPVTRQAQVTFTTTGVAGEYPTWRFEVPGNVLAVLDTISVRNATAGYLRIKTVSPGGPQASQATPYYSDGRLLEAGQSPAGAVTFGSQAGLITGYGQHLFCPSDGRVIEPPNLIIGSGREGQFGFVEFQYAVAAVSLIASMTWREYQLV